MINAIVRALSLCHLAEYQSGNATTIKVELHHPAFGAWDQKDLEQWLKEIKSVHQQMKILYNGKELCDVSRRADVSGLGKSNVA